MAGLDEAAVVGRFEPDDLDVFAEPSAFRGGGGGDVGDLLDGVGPFVIEAMGLFDLVDGELGPPSAGAAARPAASRPSRVLATISSRWNSASIDSIPNMARPSAVSVSMPCLRTFSPTTIIRPNTLPNPVHAVSMPSAHSWL